VKGKCNIEYKSGEIILNANANEKELIVSSINKTIIP
tara:strand:+ start:373 stop:483 length:111 start_codon:yes stop_codon:yes gene_type:complete